MMSSKKMNESKNNRVFRHGDLLILKIDGDLPRNVLRQNENTALALGETTGHRHDFNGQVLVFDNSDNRKLAELVPEFKEEQYLKDAVPTKFFSIQQEQELEHVDQSGQKADHNAIHLEPGNYVVVNEREFDFFGEEIRRVMD